MQSAATEARGEETGGEILVRRIYARVKNIHVHPCALCIEAVSRSYPSVSVGCRRRKNAERDSAQSPRRVGLNEFRLIGGCVLLHPVHLGIVADRPSNGCCWQF